MPVARSNRARKRPDCIGGRPGDLARLLRRHVGVEVLFREIEDRTRFNFLAIGEGNLEAALKRRVDTCDFCELLAHRVA